MDGAEKTLQTMVNMNIPSLRMCAEVLAPWEEVIPSQRRTKPKKKGFSAQVAGPAGPAVQPVQKANTRAVKVHGPEKPKTQLSGWAVSH